MRIGDCVYRQLVSLLLAVLALVCTPVVECFAQRVSESYVIHNFTGIDGLSQNTVRDLMVDKQGFLWVGTFDGLNRFDGRHFDIYKPQFGNPNSLCDGQVRKLTQDAAGFIWVRTYDKNYSCYDPQTDSFVHVLDQNGRPIRITQGSILTTRDSLCLFYNSEPGAYLIKIDKDRRPVCIWQDSVRYRDATVHNGRIFLSGEKVRVFNKSGEIGTISIDGMKGGSRGLVVLGNFGYVADGSEYVHHFNASSFEKLNDIYMPDGTVSTTLCHLTDNYLLFNGGAKGYFIYDVRAREYVDWSVLGGEQLAGKVLDIVFDNRGGSWLLDKEGVLWHYAKAHNKFVGVNLIAETTMKIVDDSRVSIYADNANKGVFWISSYGGGLVRYDENNKSSERIANSTGVIPDFLLCVTQDCNGTVWIGSELLGFASVSPSRFTCHTMRPGSDARMSALNNVRTICETPDGNVWMGIRNGSLHVYDANLEKKLITFDNIKPYAILVDQNERVWVGSRGFGIYVYDMRSFKELAHFTHKDSDPKSLANDNVFKLLADDKNRIWVATFGNGLDLVEGTNLAHLSFSHFLTTGNRRKTSIRDLYMDSDGMVWVATSDGLCCFHPERIIADPTDHVVFNYNMDDPDGLRTKDVRAICEDGNQRIWIATGGGGLNLLTFHDDKATFRAFTKKDGLPSDIITSLLCTDDSTMWIGSESGMTIMNTRSERFYNISVSQDAIANNLNDHACLIRKNGNVLWGTLDGVVEISPESRDNSAVPAVPVITRVHVNGNLVSYNPESDDIDAAPMFASKLYMPSGDNSIVFEFSSLNLSNMDLSEYSFILEGYDNAWSWPSHLNVAFYRHLAPGNYTFKVRNMAHPDFVFREISVVVQQAWWKSWWMLLLYLLVLVAVAYGVFIYFQSNPIVETVMAQEGGDGDALEKRSSKILAKISQRLQTPLNLIRTSSELMEEKSAELPKFALSHLNIINKNVLRMSDIVDGLMADGPSVKVPPLSIERTMVGPFITEVFHSFENETAKKLRCSLSAKGGWSVVLDKDKVQKVLTSFLYFAYKRTPVGGKIEISAFQDNEHMCVISVKDNGESASKGGASGIFSSSKDREADVISLAETNVYAAAHHGWVSYSPIDGGGNNYSLLIPTDYSRWNDVTVVEDNSNDLAQDCIALNDVEVEDEKDLRPLVLVVENSEDARLFYVERLSSFFATMSAVNGIEASSKIAQRLPDVILCEANMPGMDGLKLVHKLKQNFLTSQIPVVLLSSPDDKLPEDSHPFNSPNVVLVKPTSFANILAAVRNLADRHLSLSLDFSVNYGAQIDVSSEDLAVFKLFVDEVKVNERKDNFCLDDLAISMEMEASDIYDLVVRVTGCTPGDYVRLWRLSRVRQNMMRGYGLEASVHRLGLSDLAYYKKCIIRENIRV